MKILFLMGGSTQNNKEDYPLYLSEINEKLILEIQLSYYEGINASSFIFCVKEEELKKYHVKEIVEQLVDNSKVIHVAKKTKGAVCTALLAIEDINNDEELLIAGIDDFMDGEGLKIINSFRQDEADAGAISFSSVHPRYSFVKIDENNNALEFAEKNPISKKALVSCYYFKKGRDFVNGAMDVIRKDSPINNAFFISQVFNELLLKQKLIKIYNITNDQFHPLKTEAQLAQYLSEIKDIKESK